MTSKIEQIPDFLFHTAQGFYDIALHSAKNVKKETGIKGFQRLAPAAVNFSFTTELLLKGLILITTKKQIRGHSLTALFKELPEAIKIQIESKYTYHQNQDKDNKDLSAYKISVSKNKDGNSLKDDPPNTLTYLLESHEKSFENWRYLYEIENDGYIYEMDFRSLNCLIKSLFDTINSVRSND